MKFFPAQVKYRRHRYIAATIAAPVGFGVFLRSLVVTAFATGGIPEGGYGWGPFLGRTGAGITAPYIVSDRARVAHHRDAVRNVLQPTGRELSSKGAKLWTTRPLPSNALHRMERRADHP